MSLIVQKFGGSSVADADRIRNVARIITETYRKGHSVVAVLSAQGDTTDDLIEKAAELNERPSRREMDVLLNTGEMISMSLLAMTIQKLGFPVVSLTGWQIGLETNSNYSDARIKRIAGERLKAELDNGRIVIVAGFQGINQMGDVTTLGRGGSDTSGVALAVALQAQECLIFTDVDGVYTTDPRIEPKARKLDVISFEEMLELASLGSKVLQIRSVEFAGKYHVPVRVLSSLTDPNIPVDVEASSGTLISFEDDPKMEKALVSGIACTRDEAKITLSRVPDTPGVAYKILGPVAQHNIDVDMIVQNDGLDGTTDFSFTVPRGDVDKCLKVLNEEVVPVCHPEGIHTNVDIAKVSVVGIGMRTHAGVACRMFESLAAEGINIEMISTSEIKVSLVIQDKYMELAVRALHKAFNLEEDKVKL